MITIQLTGEQLRAAIHCVAKNDVRYYLNNFLIDIEKKKIIGSNGRIAYISDITIEGDTIAKRLIIEPIKINRGVDSVYIDYEHNNNSLVTIKSLDRKQHVITQKSEIVDANYPEILSKFIVSPVANDTFLFNASYLAVIEKVYGKNTEVKINAMENSVFLVEKNGIDETHSKLLIMPLLR